MQLFFDDFNVAIVKVEKKRNEIMLPLTKRGELKQNDVHKYKDEHHPIRSIFSYCTWSQSIPRDHEVSSIVFELIRTISSHLIFFHEKISRAQKAQKHITSQNQLTKTKTNKHSKGENCLFCVFIKKINWLEIVLITSNTILRRQVKNTAIFNGQFLTLIIILIEDFCKLNKTPNDGTCLGEPPGGFLWCWLLLLLFYLTGDFYVSKLVSYATGTPPWLLRSVKASTSFELYPGYFRLLYFFQAFSSQPYHERYGFKSAFFTHRRCFLPCTPSQHFDAFLWLRCVQEHPIQDPLCLPS